MILPNCDIRDITDDSTSAVGGVNQIGSADAVTSKWAIRRWSEALVWLRRILRASRRPERRLRVAETVALGERRFVAVVEFEKARFLVGGTSASLSLLARLGNTEEVRAYQAPCHLVERGESGEDEEKSAEVRL